jgi:hypothetical protein
VVSNGPQIKFSTTGNFSKTTTFLNKLNRQFITQILERYGSRGVAALRDATPVHSGLAASSWFYTVGQQDGRYWIDFHNSDIEGGAPIVILIQYGHGTKNGGYVQPHPFINEAVAPIFEQIKNDVWREVKSL